MRPGLSPKNIDPECNAWDVIRWLFVLWTFPVPLLCLALWFIYRISILWFVFTFIGGVVFLVIAHCILTRSTNSKYRSTYEMVEDDVLEIGEGGEHEQAQRAYTLCDGCEVVLSASDDIFETNCSRHHIVCSDCYNLWMRGFVQMDFVMTQGCRRQIEQHLCPICDQCIVEEGKLNLHRISHQIDFLLQSKGINDQSINVMVHNPTTVSSVSSMEMAPVSSTSSPPSVGGGNQININIQNIQNSIHITHSPGTATNSDTSRGSSNSNSNSNFEIVTSADFGGLESSLKLP